MTMTDQELKSSLNKVKIKLLSKKGSTFLTTILFSLKFKWDNSLSPPTAAVDGVNLFIHPEFWETLTLEERMGLMAHEAWHVAFNHMGNMMTMSVDKTKYNIAADYVINLILDDNGFSLPEGGLLDQQYRGMSTMEVYNTLPDSPPPPPNGGAGSLIGDIKTPEDGNQSSEEIEKANQKVEQLIMRAKTAAEMVNEDFGQMPGDVQLLIDKLSNPKLDWATILQNHMNSYCKNDYSYRRPNKRFAPDFYLPDMISENLGEIAIAVDTSGSVSDRDFAAFLAEINDIKERLNPKLTTIIDFDTSIKTVHKLHPGQSVSGLPFSGRGGTDLECVFGYYEKRSPEVLIVFSDLWCEVIEEKPPYPVIWICIENTDARVEFGKLIHFNPHE